MTDTPPVGRAPGGPAPIGHVTAPDLHVMTFNIRRRVPHLNWRSPDLWSRRQSAVARMLSSERPTLLGVQEALPDQADFVLSSLGSDYRSIGYGRRSDRSGERCRLFYDSIRLELLDWRQQALSDTPEVSGSSTWGNWIPRILVCGRFRDRMTEQEFLIVNTHLDHLSKKSRLRSIEAILEIVSRTTKPALVMGDFNTDAGSKPHRAATRTGSLMDAWVVAERRITESWSTFLNYRPPRLGRRRIDWILVSPAVEVMRAGINVTRYDGGWPSDHAPVQAVVQNVPPIRRN